MMGHNVSDTHAGQPADQRRAQYQADQAEPSGWVGWVIFAGVAMIVLGAFQIIEGLVAVFQRGYYLVTSSHLIVHVSYTDWGWVHFGIGAVIVLVGFGVMTGATWARAVGIGLAVISAIINLAFIAAYPVWGVLIIALDVVVIYALAVHGREVRYL
jgi:hypothetical protein